VGLAAILLIAAVLPAAARGQRFGKYRWPPARAGARLRLFFYNAFDPAGCLSRPPP
jgi:hypothetical protein